MSRLNQASERFDAAVDLLLRTAEPLSNAQKYADDAAARLAALNEERERLLLRIADLEQEARSLSGVTEEVENRLDSAIAEIRTALGR
jgi:chromosome segregation ATPase